MIDGYSKLGYLDAYLFKLRISIVYDIHPEQPLNEEYQHETPAVEIHLGSRPS